jgi:MSHA biogenesis protein MshM
VHRWSGGVPRRINIIAHKAMLLAFSEGVQVVQAEHVSQAVADTPAARQHSPWRWFGFALLLLSAGSVGWLVLW